MGDQIKNAAAQTARDAGRPLCYLKSSATSKEDLAREIAQRDGVRDGLIAVLSCVEPCRSFDVRCDRAAKKIELINRPRQCLHLYYYFMHSTFGFMHVRLQTWAPYTVRVSINGREWLARQMDQAGIAYVRRDPGAPGFHLDRGRAGGSGVDGSATHRALEQLQGVPAQGGPDGRPAGHPDAVCTPPRSPGIIAVQSAFRHLFPKSARCSLNRR
ncbi:MAG: hypothetical protein HY000_22725 [Planctomycetes bacterium]|nr:hypothetical protein [Planctomycetota bacterium]